MTRTNQRRKGGVFIVLALAVAVAAVIAAVYWPRSEGSQKPTPEWCAATSSKPDEVNTNSATSRVEFVLNNALAAKGLHELGVMPPTPNRKVGIEHRGEDVTVNPRHLEEELVEFYGQVGNGDTFNAERARFVAEQYDQAANVICAELASTSTTTG